LGSLRSTLRYCSFSVSERRRRGLLRSMALASAVFLAAVLVRATPVRANGGTSGDGNGGGVDSPTGPGGTGGIGGLVFGAGGGGGAWWWWRRSWLCRRVSSDIERKGWQRWERWCWSAGHCWSGGCWSWRRGWRWRLWRGCDGHGRIATRNNHGRQWGFGGSRWSVRRKRRCGWKRRCRPAVHGLA